jgi:hypothetical protein
MPQTVYAKAHLRSVACMTSFLISLKLKLHLFDLLWIYCSTSCTTCRKFVDLLYSFSTCCGQVESHTSVVRFVVESTTNPQHFYVTRCCGFVVDLSKSRKVVDLLYIVQQVHDKSNKWSLSLNLVVSHLQNSLLRPHSIASDLVG